MSRNNRKEWFAEGKRFLGNIDYNPVGLLLTEKGENTGRCYWKQKLHVTVHK